MAPAGTSLARTNRLEDRRACPGAAICQCHHAVPLRMLAPDRALPAEAPPRVRADLAVPRATRAVRRGRFRATPAQAASAGRAGLAGPVVRADLVVRAGREEADLAVAGARTVRPATAKIA